MKSKGSQNHAKSQVSINKHKLPNNSDFRGFGDFMIEKLPEKIVGQYVDDYNILYIDDIIRKKLQQEKYVLLPQLKKKIEKLKTFCKERLRCIKRMKYEDKLVKLNDEVQKIENGEKLKIYIEESQLLIEEYSMKASKIKIISFEVEDESSCVEPDLETRKRIHIIDTYLNEIACKYIKLDIIRINNRPNNICDGCGELLTSTTPSEEGTIRCQFCLTEHDIVITTKLAKDGARINMSTNSDDESIENFLRAFDRCKGERPEHFDNSIFDKLDEFFISRYRPTGEEIRKKPLNSRGRREDTNHQMLWDALFHINMSCHYEDANYIGHKYWGWTRPDIAKYRETVISHYNKTQKVFCQIPLEIRERESSLGTQFRLWRHLQLVGYECYMDEFKIAENPDSIKTHNKLWRMMCEKANVDDSCIYYIE